MTEIDERKLIFPDLYLNDELQCILMYTYGRQNGSKLTSDADRIGMRDSFREVVVPSVTEVRDLIQRSMQASDDSVAVQFISWGFGGEIAKFFSHHLIGESKIHGSPSNTEKPIKMHVQNFIGKYFLLMPCKYESKRKRA